MTKGKFIVLYGANNLGKTTQLNLLEGYFKTNNIKYKRIKYPVYDFEPTGPILNALLRNPFTLSEEVRAKYQDEFEFQKLYIQNRTDYQPHLEEYLNEGINILTEDYCGTGIAWGVTKGVDMETLISLNIHLIRPDVEILLDGERFKNEDAVEKGHRHESAADEIWKKNRRIHNELAKRFSWNIINANDEVSKVHDNILSIVKDKLTEKIINTNPQFQFNI